MAIAVKLDVINAALLEIGSLPLTSAELTADSLDRAKAANALYDGTLDEVLGRTFWGFAKRYLPLALSSPQPLNIPGGFGVAYELPGDHIRPVRLTNGGQFDVYSDFATITSEVTTLSTVGVTITFSAAHNLVVDDYVVINSGSQINEVRRVVIVTDATHVDVDAPFTADQAAGTAWKSAKGYKLYLITDISNPKLEYIARVTNPAQWIPMFTQAMIKRLAAKFALSLINSRNLAESLLQEYNLTVAEAEAISGQSHNRPHKIQVNALTDARRISTVRNDKVLD